MKFEIGELRKHDFKVYKTAEGLDRIVNKDEETFTVWIGAKEAGHGSINRIKEVIREPGILEMIQYERKDEVIGVALGITRIAPYCSIGGLHIE